MRLARGAIATLLSLVLLRVLWLLLRLLAVKRSAATGAAHPLAQAASALAFRVWVARWLTVLLPLKPSAATLAASVRVWVTLVLQTAASHALLQAPVGWLVPFVVLLVLAALARGDLSRFVGE